MAYRKEKIDISFIRSENPVMYSLFFPQLERNDHFALDMVKVANFNRAGKRNPSDILRITVTLVEIGKVPKVQETV